MGLILSLDIGSTNIKGVVFDTAGCEVTSSTTKLRPVKRAGGYVERDLDLVWECTKAGKGMCKDRGWPTGWRASVSGAGDGLVLLGDRKNRLDSASPRWTPVPLTLWPAGSPRGTGEIDPLIGRLLSRNCRCSSRLDKE